MKPTPAIGRRSALRAFAVFAAVAGTAFVMAATSSPAAAAPTQVATPDAGFPPPGHHHLIGVL
ncbi:hypothetical protein [uncultured Arthrobacter sp.]|uniref:hypothetical protein n=1 Tax=uncultured Arthrobacter sp. TaxID=114050 RepID=UPI0028D12B1F|nr:hypothetical protein [uncultured Arthrobacter sp.]